MEKKIVEVAYKFEIKYENEKHLNNIIKELKDTPIFDLGGAGIIDGKAYGYSCKRKGKGRIAA